MDIHIDVPDIGSVEKRLGSLRHKAPNALYLAINRAAGNVKANMGKETKKRYRINSREVTGTVTIAKASRSTLRALVTSSGSPRELMKYEVSSSGSRIKAGVKKGAMKNLDGNPRTFIATMVGPKGGLHTAPFARYGLGANKAGVMSKRRPGKDGGVTKHNVKIHEMLGPSIPSIVKNEETMSVIRQEAVKTLEARISHEVQRILEKG